MDEGIVINGEIQLHYLAEGPEQGEPVLLLHGFPQFSYMWRHQLKALAQAGYRAVAPDLRGYNLSSKPQGVEAYTAPNLLSDLGAFYQHFGWPQANLVVHDWGGILGWYFAALQPQLVKKMVAIDIAHPSAVAKAMQQGLQQLQRSWYIWFFQFPEVAEARFGGANLDSFIYWMFQSGKEPGFISWGSGNEAFSAEDLARYKEVFAQPGQLTAAINWYRANFNPVGVFTQPPQPLPSVTVPTLLIYGTEDGCFASSIWQDSALFCSGPFQLAALEGVGHWAPEEAPDEVNRLILEHLKS